MNTGILIKEVKRLARENPDAIYSPPGHRQCYYTKGRVKKSKLTTCGCIIGQAARRVHEKLWERMCFHEDRGHGSRSIGNIIQDYPKLFPRISNKQITWLKVVQSRQDTMTQTWGQAVDQNLHLAEIK